MTIEMDYEKSNTLMKYNFIKENLDYGYATDKTESIIDICKRVIRYYNDKKKLHQRLFDIVYRNQYSSEERIKHELSNTFIGTLRYRKMGREPFTINTMVYLIHKRLIDDEYFNFVSDDIAYQHLICLLVSVGKLNLKDENGDCLIHVDTAFSLITGDKAFDGNIDGLRLDNDFQLNFRWIYSDLIFEYDKKNQPRFKLKDLPNILGVNNTALLACN